MWSFPGKEKACPKLSEQAAAFHRALIQLNNKDVAAPLTGILSFQFTTDPVAISCGYYHNNNGGWRNNASRKNTHSLIASLTHCSHLPELLFLR